MHQYYDEIGLAVEILILLAVVFEAWISYLSYKILKKEDDK